MSRRLLVPSTGDTIGNHEERIRKLERKLEQEIPTPRSSGGGLAGGYLGPNGSSCDGGSVIIEPDSQIVVPFACAMVANAQFVVQSTATPLLITIDPAPIKGGGSILIGDSKTVPASSWGSVSVTWCEFLDPGSYWISANVVTSGAYAASNSWLTYMLFPERGADEHWA